MVVEGVSETVCFVGSVDDANVVEELDEVSSVNLVFLDDLKTF